MNNVIIRNVFAYCLFLLYINFPILVAIVIDSDSDDEALPIKDGTNNTCDCYGVNCLYCTDEKMRKIICKLYHCYPLIDNHSVINKAIAQWMKLPIQLIRRLIEQYHRYLSSDKKYVHKLPPGFTVNNLNSLMPLELCQIKRKILSCKPFQFANILSECCKTYKYRCNRIDLIKTIFESNEIAFRRITHRVTKQSKLIAIEKSAKRLERLTFIQQIQKYRSEGQRIIFINEVKPTESNTQSLIMVAYSIDGPLATGFMKNANTCNFIKWLKKVVFEKLTESCVFVLSASSMFRTCNTTPVSTDSKSKIIAWLQQKNIPHTDDMYKIELYDLVLQNNPTQQMEYLIDVKLKENGHQILYIPKNNNDLDPMEYIWLNIKLKMIARNNNSFNMNQELHNMPQSKWREYFKRAITVEDDYLQIENNFDHIINRYAIDNVEYVQNDILTKIDTIHC